MCARVALSARGQGFAAIVPGKIASDDGRASAASAACSGAPGRDDPVIAYPVSAGTATKGCMVAESAVTDPRSGIAPRDETVLMQNENQVLREISGAPR